MFHAAKSMLSSVGGRGSQAQAGAEQPDTALAYFTSLQRVDAAIYPPPIIMFKDGLGVFLANR
jgi:hypothetical protein